MPATKSLRATVQAASNTPTLCLFMIVKNETLHMPRLIANVAPLIDHAVICDTGSTDSTLECTRDALQQHGVAYTLHQHEWRNFGHNRTLALRAARGICDYLLTLDADSELVYQPSAAIKPQLATRLDEYSLTLEHGSLEFRRMVIFKDDPRIDWQCVGAVHEYFTAGAHNATRGHVADIRIRTVGEAGGVRSGRFERDLALLRDEVAHNPQDTRAQFYLAQTLRDLGRPQESAVEYRKRATMGGWHEEVYYSLFQAAVLDGDAYDLLRAFAYRPGRADAAYACAKAFRDQQDHALALLVCERYQANRHLAADDVLFIARDPKQWGMELEHALARYYTGDVAGFTQRSEQLLRDTTLPEHIRELVQNNLAQYGLGKS
ncbi:MAG TPA: glycosyltransferase [Hyphomicrobiales bacterium]|nr:glycosyltransferase [Hyphomicrobiales bacterium]